LYPLPAPLDGPAYRTTQRHNPEDHNWHECSSLRDTEALRVDISSGELVKNYTVPLA
jgi:hypothetical protein